MKLWNKSTTHYCDLAATNFSTNDGEIYILNCQNIEWFVENYCEFIGKIHSWSFKLHRYGFVFVVFCLGETRIFYQEVMLLVCIHLRLCETNMLAAMLFHFIHLYVYIAITHSVTYLPECHCNVFVTSFSFIWCLGALLLTLIKFNPRRDEMCDLMKSGDG